MWWFLQILAICCISLVHTFNRWAGINGIAFLTKFLVNSGAQIAIAPLFILSYGLAPSFFQPWFLGTILIAIVGFVISIIFFGEAVTFLKIVGVILGLIGSVLLIL